LSLRTSYGATILRARSAVLYAIESGKGDACVTVQLVASHPRIKTNHSFRCEERSDRLVENVVLKPTSYYIEH